MKIAYVHKSSLIDYPGRISAVVFTIGCTFRCPYCHNPELVVHASGMTPIPDTEVLSFLEKRKGKLDAVVLSGGEPTMQPGLQGFMKKVKAMGFLVKLDTNGSRPEVLERVIAGGLADYVAMDIKAPPRKYATASGTLVDISRVHRSIEIIMHGRVPYEFRTTFVPSLHEPEDIVEIARMIEGANVYAIQRFVPSKHIDRAFMHLRSPEEEELVELAETCGRWVGRCLVR
ncbi:MAG TPA: anaerobic ribonucleoside-triphosphate reductase activating protein [Deltaproteobacteria bacterium]|nr:anaerobic ribonucleoside-triphosphate reductase activating protein [Deltaproteobacteria bacterium]HOM28511.1 anaerobic ribonucleoside-triphosphate reductase activating protein [Deltaproteobacteria bacterium]HPP79707.1 anaerobic ribonucleoside-triphosphate reductase activating protein [Deltaproteobacteria bacterium]